MSKKITLPAAKAREKFFEILKEVEKSKDALYVITVKGVGRAAILNLDLAEEILAKFIREKKEEFLIRDKGYLIYEAKKPIKRRRVLLDTSVPSDWFNKEDLKRQEKTKLFFEQIKKGRFEAFITHVTQEELSRIKDIKTRKKTEELVGLLPVLPITPQCRQLAEAYVKNKVLSSRYLNDALHVAVATVHQLDTIASWNFRHLVNIDRKIAFNRVNVNLGFDPIEILSPEELIYDED
jgi:predicted nucleic acid-binding protein